MGQYSFILKHSHEGLLNHLTDDQAGKLFKAIFAYSKREETCQSCDIGLSMAFDVIKESLDEEAEKYREICKKRRDAAKARHGNKST